MIKKGIVANKIKENEVRVVIPQEENNVSYILKVPKHITDISIDDVVVIAIYSKTDGIVVGVL